MENDAVREEAMELEVEFSSFTESIDKICVKRAIRNWPVVKSALEIHGLSASLNQAERSITVSTTARTGDPDIIERAKDCITIFSKVKIDPEQAIKVLNGELHHEYIKTGFQKDGLAAIHGMKKAQYEKKAKSLFKHIKDIGTMIRCVVYIGEDCVVVTCGEEFSSARRMAHIIWAVKSCIVENRTPKRISKRLEEVLTAILHQNQMEACLQNLVI